MAGYDENLDQNENQSGKSLTHSQALNLVMWEAACMHHPLEFSIYLISLEIKYLMYRNIRDQTIDSEEAIWSLLYTSHSAYVATSTELHGVKIDGFLYSNFM